MQSCRHGAASLPRGCSPCAWTTPSAHLTQPRRHARSQARRSTAAACIAWLMAAMGAGCKPAIVACLPCAAQVQAAPSDATPSATRLSRECSSSSSSNSCTHDAVPALLLARELGGPNWRLTSNLAMCHAGCCCAVDDLSYLQQAAKLADSSAGKLHAGQSGTQLLHHARL